MKKILENITITSVGNGGVGISTAPDGRKVIVKGGVLPGSVLDATIIRKKSDYYECHVHTIHHIDPAYTGGDIQCPHYLFHSDRANMPVNKTGCGGCKWQIIKYPKQLELKRDLVQDAFHEIIDKVPTIGLPLAAPLIFGYRNKIEYSFGKYISKVQNLEEHRSLGFHQQGQFSKIIDIDQCFLVDQTGRTIYQTIKQLCIDSGLPVYDQMRHSGVLRHLMIRQGTHTGEVMVIISMCNESKEYNPNTWIRFLETLKNHPIRERITTCIVTVNNGKADIIFDRQSDNQIIWGEGVIHEKLTISGHEKQFQIGPHSFFQTNTTGAQVLFDYAHSLMEKSGGLLLDLYCGAGTIGQCFSDAFEQIIGVDIVEGAIENAHTNMKLNNISNATYIAGKAEKIVESLTNLDKLTTIIIDPPREGLHKDVVEFINNLVKKQKFQLIYISCNPVTMARDCAMMIENGWKVNTLQPVDMFPHTHHIETVGSLSYVG